MSKPLSREGISPLSTWVILASVAALPLIWKLTYEMDPTRLTVLLNAFSFVWPCTLIGIVVGELRDNPVIKTLYMCRRLLDLALTAILAANGEFLLAGLACLWTLAQTLRAIKQANRSEPSHWSVLL